MSGRFPRLNFMESLIIVAMVVLIGAITWQGLHKRGYTCCDKAVGHCPVRHR